MGQELKNSNNTIQFLRTLHYTTKLETVLVDLFSTIRLVSIIDVLIWMLTLILYFMSNFKMVFTWIHIIHFLRGCAGAFVLKWLPRSEMLIDCARPLIANGNQDFYEVLKATGTSLIETSFKGKRNFSIFYVLSFLCYVTDIICIIYIVDWTRRSEADVILKLEVEFLAYLFACITYLFADLLYFYWNSKLSFLFPISFSRIITGMSEGFVDNFKVFAETVKENSVGRLKETQKKDTYGQTNNEKNEEPRLFDRPGAIEIEFKENEFPIENKNEVWKKKENYEDDIFDKAEEI